MPHAVPEPTLLITNAEVIVTMDDQRRELRGGSLLVRGPRVEAIWPAGEMPPGTAADATIDAAGHAVLPGLVNTHHHMYQSLTRAIPAAQDAELFTWLKTLYPIWAGLTPEMVQVSTQVAMAELLLMAISQHTVSSALNAGGCNSRSISISRKKSPASKISLFATLPDRRQNKPSRGAKHLRKSSALTRPRMMPGKPSSNYRRRDAHTCRFSRLTIWRLLMATASCFRM